MKIYIKANDDYDYGFGFDGAAIDESTVDEMYRIAGEILDQSELAQLDPYVTIDEDSFKYYATGSAWGADLEYGIRFDAHSSKFDFKSFFNWGKIEREQISWADPDSENVLATVRFFIAVDGDTISADVEDITVTIDGLYSEYETENYQNILDMGRFSKDIQHLAEPVVNEIHATLSNI